MTTPSLGDLTQIPVTLRPSQGLPALGDTTVTLYNQDITNVVYASYQQWFAPGQGNSIPIQPLGSITLSAKKAIYIASLVAVQPLLILPEGSNVQPSPAQVAAQINALGLMKDTTGQAINTGTVTVAANTTGVAKDTSVAAVNTTLGTPAQDPTLVGQNTAIPNNIATTGVPLLTKNTVSASNSAGVGIAANGVLHVPASGQNSLTQVGFEFLISGKYTTVNGTNPFVLVVIKWFDSTTSLQIDEQSFVTCVTQTSGGTVLTTRFKGSTKGDSYNITVYNLDSLQAITVKYALVQNSRIYTRDEIDWLYNQFDAAQPIIPSNTLPTSLLPDQQTLAVCTDTALAASATDTWLIPPNIGPVYLNIAETGVAGANMTIQAQMMPGQGTLYGTSIQLINQLMGSGAPNEFSRTLIPGAGPWHLVVKNGGSVAANYSAIIVAEG